MILQVKIINGVKKLVPLTTDSGQGLPLGAITAYYGTTAPNGYLLCDGSSFDSTVYPALYTLLGDNHTPDLRECTLKGIGENPNATDHVKAGGLTLGEFLDDRIQDFRDGSKWRNFAPSEAAGWGFLVKSSSGTNVTGRFGATTEVKSVGVNYIIKAVIGPIESSEADQVVQTVNNSRSYSTDEINTGKTWIDGKPIYRKCCVLTSTVTVSDPIEWVNLINKSTYGLESIKFIIQGWVWREANKGPANGLALSPGNGSYIQVHREGVTWQVNAGSVVILEYTKTTD